MAKRAISQLKNYFLSGKRPTESQFGDFIDSFAHLDGPELARMIEHINTENGNLRLKSKYNEIIAQISLTDIRNNMGIPGTLVQSVNGQTGNVTLNLEGPEDVGSTREGILKNFTTENNSTKIFHLKLPYRVDTHFAMYHIKATGHAYQSVDIIDVTWIGYCYKPMGALIQEKAFVNASSSITAGQYVGSDSHIYLWFKLPTIYYSTFKLDSMRVGNGTLLKEGDIQLITSDLVQL